MNQFDPRFNIFKLLWMHPDGLHRFVSVFCISPLRLFPCRSSPSRNLQLLITLGMEPLKAFLLRSRCWMLLKLNNQGGIAQSKPFWLGSSNSRDVKSTFRNWGMLGRWHLDKCNYSREGSIFMECKQLLSFGRFEPDRSKYFKEERVCVHWNLSEVKEFDGA